MSGGTRYGLPDGAFGIVPDDDPRSRLAAAIRPIITMLVASSFEDGDLEEATAAVEEVRATLASRAGPKRARQHPDVARHAQEIFPTSPIIGMANPVAPPVAVRIVDGPEGGYREIHGEAWFDWQYEGPTVVRPRRGHRRDVRRDARGRLHRRRASRDDRDADRPVPQADAAALPAAPRGPVHLPRRPQGAGLGRASTATTC